MVTCSYSACEPTCQDFQKFIITRDFLRRVERFCLVSPAIEVSPGLVVSSSCACVYSRNAQVEPGVWELDGTLDIRVGSTLKIVGQVCTEKKSSPVALQEIDTQNES